MEQEVGGGVREFCLFEILEVMKDLKNINRYYNWDGINFFVFRRVDLRIVQSYVSFLV